MEKAIREVLSSHGDVREVYEETWSKGYRYQVYNGVRIAMTNLKKHLPSLMIIAGSKVLITYKDQPPTCFGRNKQDHTNQVCPRCRQIETESPFCCCGHRNSSDTTATLRISGGDADCPHTLPVHLLTFLFR